jgi:hypothetical protein
MASLQDTGTTQDILEEYTNNKDSTIEIMNHQKKIIDEYGRQFSNPRFEFDDMFSLIKESMIETINGGNEFISRPEQLSFALYNTHDLWYLLLRLNNCLSRKDFKGPLFKVIKNSSIPDLLVILKNSQLKVKSSTPTIYKDLTIRKITSSKT